MRDLTALLVLLIQKVATRLLSFNNGNIEMSCKISRSCISLLYTLTVHYMTDAQTVMVNPCVINALLSGGGLCVCRACEWDCLGLTVLAGPNCTTVRDAAVASGVHNGALCHV